MNGKGTALRLLLGSILAFAIAAPAAAQLAPPNDAGITYGHVHLNVRDIEVHKKLWVEHFDAVLVQKGPLVAVTLRDWYVDTFSLVPRKRGTIVTTADAPGMNLSFATSKNANVGTKGRTIDHIGFEVKNLEAFCKKLEARGVKFDVPFRNVPAIGLNIAYITDPSGVYIELTEGYDKY